MTLRDTLFEIAYELSRVFIGTCFALALLIVMAYMAGRLDRVPSPPAIPRRSQSENKPMDPRRKSWLTTAAVAIVVCAGTLAADHGIITKTDSETIITAIMTIAGFGGLGAYKASQVSPEALIRAVNAGDNGVKVVAVDASAPAVDKPLK